MVTFQFALLLAKLIVNFADKTQLEARFIAILLCVCVCVCSDALLSVIDWLMDARSALAGQAAAPRLAHTHPHTQSDYNLKEH